MKDRNIAVVIAAFLFAAFAVVAVAYVRLQNEHDSFRAQAARKIINLAIASGQNPDRDLKDLHLLVETWRKEDENLPR